MDGVGLGLRWELADELEATLPALPFLEVAPENYIGRDGRYGALLETMAAHYPLLSHGLSLSIGGHEPLDPAFLRQLRTFLDRLNAPHHSDHLCFGWTSGANLHDLLPIVRSKSEVQRIAERIERVQDALGRPFAIEHVSAYLEPDGCEIPEPEFLQELCAAAECALLLDVNNLDVNAENFGFDPFDWLRRAPLDRVVHVHVAGPDWFDLEDGSGLWVDTHGSAPRPRALALLTEAIRTTGPRPVVLEWDSALPDLPTLLQHLAEVRASYAAGLGPP